MSKSQTLSPEQLTEVEAIVDARLALKLREAAHLLFNATKLDAERRAISARRKRPRA